MSDKMEISVGDYGRFLFENLVGTRKDHSNRQWEAIRAEAEPLVRQLLALNEKLEYPYELTGYHTQGKKKLSRFEKIRLAQDKELTVRVSQLREGDEVWLVEPDFDMEVDGRSTVFVKEITENSVYVEHPHVRLGGTYRMPKTSQEKVLRKPADWYVLRMDEDDYWLKRAEEMGL